MVRSPYEVLGISENATADEIKTAYRKKAKECHPDLHPDDPNAQEKMNEVNAAYDMLSNPDKYQTWKAQQAAYGNGQAPYGSYSNPYGGYSTSQDFWSQMYREFYEQQANGQGPKVYYYNFGSGWHQAGGSQSNQNPYGNPYGGRSGSGFSLLRFVGRIIGAIILFRIISFIFYLLFGGFFLR